MDLLIKPYDSVVRGYYLDHQHFHPGDAGLDLFAVERQIIAPRSTDFIHFRIACENPQHRPYLLLPRSSISRTPLRMCNSIGLIDGGYRGEIIAAVDNICDEEYIIEPGQRLFQLVAMDGSPINFTLVDNLSDTSRGGGGFGSTGR